MTNVEKIKKVAIAGAGGIGAYATQFLFDYGANRGQYPWTSWEVDLFDDDIVEPGNLLHQNFSEDDLGRRKAEIVAEKCFVTPNYRFMTPADFPNYDVIFSCVDGMEFRKSLYEYGFAHPELVWFDARCQSRIILATHSGVSQKVLKTYLTESKERAGCLRSVDKVNKISHATPIIVAATMTQLFLNYLRGEILSSPLELQV